MKRLVADTGPILHLHEAGALHLFLSIGEVLLAPLVLAELRVHAPALWPGQLPRWASAQTLSPVRPATRHRVAARRIVARW